MRKSDVVKLGAAVAINVDRSADALNDGEIKVAGENDLAAAGGNDRIAPGIENVRGAAVHGLTRLTAGVAGDDEHLVFDRTGRREGIPMILAQRGPLGGNEEHVQTGQRKGAHQLEEADVVADDDAALFAVKLEGGHMGAGLVIVMLAHRGEEMGFVVFGDARALTVKDVGGVVNLVVLNVGNGTGHDVDVQLMGQGGAHVLDSSTVLVAQLLEILLREESGVPGFGKDDHVGLGSRGFTDEFFRMLEVVSRVGKFHIHLDCADSHNKHLPP